MKRQNKRLLFVASHFFVSALFLKAVKTCSMILCFEFALCLHWEKKKTPHNHWWNLSLPGEPVVAATINFFMYIHCDRFHPDPLHNHSALFRTQVEDIHMINAPEHCRQSTSPPFALLKNWAAGLGGPVKPAPRLVHHRAIHKNYFAGMSGEIFPTRAAVV